MEATWRGYGSIVMNVLVLSTLQTEIDDLEDFGALHYYYYAWRYASKSVKVWKYCDGCTGTYYTKQHTLDDLKDLGRNLTLLYLLSYESETPDFKYKICLHDGHTKLSHCCDD